MCVETGITSPYSAIHNDKFLPRDNSSDQYSVENFETQVEPNEQPPSHFEGSLMPFLT